MRKLLYFLLLTFMISSCSTQEKILYLQNNQIGVDYPTYDGGEIRLQNNDMISIVVTSKTPELAAIFNPTKPSSSGGSSSDSDLTYTVDPNGEINFPVLGHLKVAGLTRFEISDMISKKIIESEMLRDPLVIVTFENLSFSTLGDIGAGSYTISKDKTSILEAISMAGDLAITGQRNKVFLTRNIDGVLKTYQLDLRTTDIYMSPAFYIQQNDLIYVEPNKVKSNQSTINGNSLRSISFWMSITSFLMTLTFIFL